MKNSRIVSRTISISLSLVLAVGALLSAPTAVAQSADVATISGVVTVALNTDSGQQIKLTLPVDMRAGDTISGTVEEVSLPRNGDTLEGAVVDIGGKRHLLRNRILTFVVPAAAAIALPIILKDRAGREMAREQIPVHQSAGLNGSIPTQLGNLSNFQPPRIGQTGRELAIAGKFDGQAATTNISVGNQPVEFLAESPRSTFAKLPANAPPGPTMLTVEEVFNVPGRAPTRVREQSKFNVLSVELSAGKLHLNRGESTQLQVTVRGLQGLEDCPGGVELKLQNLSPQIVRFNSTKGDLIITKVTAIPDQPHGVMTFSEKLTGLSVGAFTIRAALKAGDDPETPRDWVRRIAELKREAANRCGENSDARKELRENADNLDATADNKDNWDKNDQPKNKDSFKKFLEEEKKKLDKIQKKVGADSEVGKKIGDAKDAVDKAAEEASVELDEE